MICKLDKILVYSDCVPFLESPDILWYCCHAVVRCSQGTKPNQELKFGGNFGKMVDNAENLKLL